MADFKTLLHEALQIFCFESVVRSAYQTAKVTPPSGEPLKFQNTYGRNGSLIHALNH